MESKAIKVSVRNLIEFVLRSGDLDNRKLGTAEQEAMQAGNRIHRKIQKSMGANYHPEVTLKHVVFEQEFELAIEGRADGIIIDPNTVTIDEIKGVYRDLKYLEEPEQLHLAQAMCYGYIYGIQKELSAITLQVTYCNLESEEIRRFQCMKTMVELREWFDGLIHEYIKWARYLYRHGLQREESLKELVFPYDYRKGQKELAACVYRTIVQGKRLFVQAPTGTGKTLSTIYPALKAMALGYGEKLFYLTAKTTTRQVAEEAFALLRKKGMHFRTVTITAKDKLCHLDKPDCNPDTCYCARGHFDRINEAVYDIIHREFAITKEVLIAYAKQYQVCPFEFCLDISSWVDGIICDYNYVFHPNVRLKRYFSAGVSGAYLFLIDEAHNLVPRAREMYSAQLIKEDFLEVKRLLSDRSPRVVKQLNRCNQYLLEQKRACSDYEIQTDIHFLVMCLMSLIGEIEALLEEQADFAGRERLLEFYFSLKNFISIFEELDECYQIYTQLRADLTFVLKLFCINPAKQLMKCLEKGNSSIFFSATLLPVNYYKELLSGSQEDPAVYANSPFHKEQRLLLVASDVSSKYTRRNLSEYQKVVSYIIQIAAIREGNYMVFLPSYHYLEQVYLLLREHQELTLLIQSMHMEETERETFLQAFRCQKQGSLVALCVIGGMFSEGIDLKGKELIGVVIVGTGLPMICVEQEILKDYFTINGYQGYQYAYQYPGMNKVLQAAGRVIRTAYDQGIILLLDQRFLMTDYQALFPREWDSFIKVNRSSVSGVIGEFWEKMDLLNLQ